MRTEWAESLRKQCEAVGVAFFMKQMGVGGKVTGEISIYLIAPSVGDVKLPSSVRTACPN